MKWVGIELLAAGVETAPMQKHCSLDPMLSAEYAIAREFIERKRVRRHTIDEACTLR